MKAYWPDGTSLGIVTLNEVPVTPVARTLKVFMPSGGMPALSSMVTGPLASIHFSSKGWPVITSKLVLVILGLAEAMVARAAATMAEVNFILATGWRDGAERRLRSAKKLYRLLAENVDTTGGGNRVKVKAARSI